MLLVSNVLYARTSRETTCRSAYGRQSQRKGGAELTVWCAIRWTFLVNFLTSRPSEALPPASDIFHLKNNVLSNYRPLMRNVHAFLKSR